MSHFHQFIENSTGADKNQVILNLLTTNVAAKKAAMAFAISHTEELVALINLSAKKNEPIGVIELIRIPLRVAPFDSTSIRP